uniref:Uncharacterized protein n=1 Tax=Arundo donax TaxID=35708 RepID=A0A0A9GLM9_ARUDO
MGAPRRRRARGQGARRRRRGRGARRRSARRRDAAAGAAAMQGEFVGVGVTCYVYVIGKVRSALFLAFFSLSNSQSPMHPFPLLCQPNNTFFLPPCFRFSK